MHRIELSDRELDELYCVLQNEVDVIRVETRRTDDRAFKKEVRQRRQALEHILEIVTAERQHSSSKT